MRRCERCRHCRVEPWTAREEALICGNPAAAPVRRVLETVPTGYGACRAAGQMLTRAEHCKDFEEDGR